MKYSSLAVLVPIIMGIAIVAPSLVGNAPVKNTAMTQPDKDQGSKAPSQAADEQNTTSKAESFTAGKALDEEKDGPDTTTAMVRSGNTMVDKGKTYLLTQVDNRLKQLGPFRTRIENMPALSDADRKSMVSELDAEIETFKGFKAEINKSATKQDIKDVAEKIKAEWLNSRRSVADAKEKIQAAKANQLVADADSVSSDIQKRIDFLKASGEGTKASEQLLSAYGKKIADAKQAAESANAKRNALASASTDAEKAKLAKEKELLLKRSQENVKDAYKLLAVEARRDFRERMK